MTITFACPACGQPLSVPARAAGTCGRCCRCHERILVPQIPSVAPTPASPSPATASPQPTAPQTTSSGAAASNHRPFFSTLSPGERLRALDFSEFYWQSVLDARRGSGVHVDNDPSTAFVPKLSDGEITQAIALCRLNARAVAVAESGNWREAVRLYQQICAIAPFDPIAWMSLGVQYAQGGDGRSGVKYLEKALQIDPGNQRVRENLRAVKAYFRG